MPATGQPGPSANTTAPSGGTIGLSVSVLSYAGAVRIGVRSDGGVIADPEALVAGFEDELRELLS